MNMQPQIARACLLLALAAAAVPALAALSAEELAKLAQNPMGNLVSVPFQNNTNFNTGPENGTQNILNIQAAAAMDRADRRRRRQDLSPRQAADQL